MTDKDRKVRVTIEFPEDISRVLVLVKIEKELRRQLRSSRASGAKSRSGSKKGL